MQELRRVPVHGSLTRRHLIAGCNRTLFFLLSTFAGILLMSGLTNMYWPNVVFAVLLWIIFIPVLAKLARYEPHASGILIRNLRYSDVSLPAAGKPGASKLVLYKRWS